jgi:hypothetical protein
MINTPGCTDARTCLNCPSIRQGTTGVLILARTKALARELSRQFRTRTIEKTYLALVHGDPGAWTGPSANASTGSGARARAGLITAPLSLGSDGRVRVRIHHRLEDRLLHPLEEARGRPEVGDAADLGPGRRLDQLDQLVGGNLKAAQTAWEVLASSVSFRIVMMGMKGYPSVCETFFNPPPSPPSPLSPLELICGFGFLPGRRTVVAGASASAYGVEAPVARAHGPRSWGYVRSSFERPRKTKLDMPGPFAAPILGDALYGSATTNSPVSARTCVPEGRLFLHSSSISFWVREDLFFL